MNQCEEIRYNDFLRIIRKEKNASYEKLGYGLYSPAMMHYIEKGEKTPDYRFRNRLLARLGISSERYEDFVQFDEYDRWKKCQDLIFAIEQEDMITAKSIIDDLETDGKDKIEKQFILDMKARLSLMSGEDCGKAILLYREAIELTMPQLPIENLKEYLLAPDEIYLILKYLSLQNRYVNKPDDYRSQKSRYISVLEYIRSSQLRFEAKAKVYPMAVVGYYNLLKKSANTIVKDWDELCRYSNDAIELLREAKRSYYLSELIGAREAIYDMYTSVACDNSITEETINSESAMNIALNSLRDEYNVSIDVENSGFIYDDAIVCCLNDIIRTRRLMYGMSRGELSEMICSERTIMRIENKKVKAQTETVSRLLLKLGLSSDYRRSEIMTDDIQVLNTYARYLAASNDSDARQKKQLLLQLKKELPASKWNQQFLIRLINLQKINRKEISVERFADNLERALDLTLPRNFKCSPDSYFTKSEMVIFMNLASKGHKEKYKDMLIKKCDFYEENGVRNYKSIYNSIMGNAANELGNLGKYDESNAISQKIIIEDLKSYRLHSVHVNISNIAWNKAKLNKDPSNNVYADILKQSITISDFCRDNTMNMVYNSKLNQLNAGKDWTI